jgi:plastocyanin
VREIVPGTTIRWRAVAARTFDRRGTFRYYCTIHDTVVDGVCSGMCGRIVIS